MSGQGLILYVVEDDITYSRYLELILRGCCDHIRFFSGGEGFVRSLEQGERPDLVILDYQLGSMNGLECMMILKERYPDVKVIMLSSNENVEITMQLIQAGAYDYIVKDAQAAINLKRSIDRYQETETGYYTWN